MGIVRMGRCASCGTPVLWLRAWGFGEPRPLELQPDPEGDAVIDPVEARHRAYVPGPGDGLHRYRLHWPCPAAPTTGRDRNGRASASTGANGGTVTVAVVPQTHWDREWYSPFQTFRLRLVRVLDQLLDVLEDDPSFTHFVLDGQTAMVDDYLEVRPEAEGRIRRLAIAGRLALGPWHTQPDEFLVSGETLVRNLQTGIARSAELGGTLAVGYLPDSFGHVAQMPQLLRAAGIDHAVVFRGVPDSVWCSGFWWEAPDGSRVRAEHLVHGYSVGFQLPADADTLIAEARNLVEVLGNRRVGSLLLTTGGDHEPPRHWAGKVVAEANQRAGSGLHFEVTGLEDFLARQPVGALPTWRGELRASGPSTVTMGVASNRVDVKLAAASAERAVERRAEPLSALLLPAAEYPARLLELAWRRLLDNAAHDSACACSVDEVVDQVLLRYHEARQIGDGLAAEAVTSLARHVEAPPGSLLVVNAGGHSRMGAVRFSLPGRGAVHLESPDGSARPAQVLATTQAVQMDATTPGRDIGVVLDLFGAGTFAGRPVARWHPADADRRVVLEMATAGEARGDLSEAARTVREWADAEPHEVTGVVLLQAPVREVVALAGPIPGFGWTAYRVVDGDGPTTGVTGGDGWIANEHVRVDVDGGNGTFAVTTADGLHVAGLNRYVDGGDAGDTYNWSPPLQDHVVDVPVMVEVERVATGPVLARLVIRARYPWPVTTDVETTVAVVAGEPFVRVEVSFLNAHPDHRLRAHFPLPAAVTGSHAECAFAVVHRGLTHEGNPIEAGLATFPARRFVDCSDGATGLALVHDGVGEYEVVDDGRELALTLLRTVGLLSRDDGRLRPVAAGPSIVIPHAEQLGPFRRSYAVLLHRGDWADADLYARADDALLPFEHTWVEAADGAVRPTGGLMAVDGAEVTAVRREDRMLVVRMVRAADEPGPAEIRWDGAPGRGWSVDLCGRPLLPVDGTLTMRPWEIATVRLHAGQ